MFINQIITNYTNYYTNIRRNSSIPPKYSNLAPLSKDTISFTSGIKTAGKPEDGIDLKTSEQIYKEANNSYNYLNNILNDIFDGLISDDDETKPIKCIKSRIKEPYSICEKSASRKLGTVEEVKSKLTDIVGARIVMSDSSTQAVDTIINKLTEAVKDDKIKILEIENYRPEPEIDDNGEIVKTYDYASPIALSRLKKACDTKNDTFIRKADEDQPSGYMAIHLLIQLPNNFVGELQIIGEEVEQLKDIEDMCFKVKNGKHLSDKYNEVENIIINKFNKNDEITKKEFNKYTRKAYIYQRESEEIHKKDNHKNSNFLTIPEYLPKDLDFNNIAKFIEECNK